MGYRNLQTEINDEVTERLSLVMERIADIVTEQGASVGEACRDCFVSTAEYLLLLLEICDRSLSGELAQMSEEMGEELNHRLFDDVQEPGYGSSYANPAYAVQHLGSDCGQLLSALIALLHDGIWRMFEGERGFLCIYAELFIELYNRFEDAEGTDIKELLSILGSFMHDYTELFCADGIARQILPEYDYWMQLLMSEELSGTAHLYRYGLCIGKDELETARFLSGLNEEKIKMMADTFTEGYRKGFAVTGKDIRKKSVVEVRYPVGFERMVRQAVLNFHDMGMDAVLKPYSVSLNKQYVYDHREDVGLWLDKAYVERALEVKRSTWEHYRAQAPRYGGPAVIETFGAEPFAPAAKPECVRLTKRQQELLVHERGESSRLCSQAIRGEERSFTIIAFPVPSIGEKFPEIFEETVRLNTLDYELYRDMQQRLIDVLDTAEYVHILGAKGNRTDLTVHIAEPENPQRETAFENCVADVNIPVGEVFTTPVLAGTCGKLHVSLVYLRELAFVNLELEFRDGMVTDYSCANFADEEENRRYIEENLLCRHSSLPMGEFAIGTNTTAYCMAKKYGIASRLPILIAEKTGPHFAVGDTCYTYDEDNITTNPDGKEIVARDNEVSAQRGKDGGRTYFNCHTDITLPYDELDRIEVIRRDGTRADVIAGGRFVVPGTGKLNEPFDGTDDE